jgi:integrase
VFSTPKTHQVRTVPIPRFLVEDIAQLTAGKAPDDFVFVASKGGLLRLQNFRHVIFDRAVRSAGLDGLTPHALRHTAASLAIAAGADVKVLQQMLGHASATMTLDLYGHLWRRSARRGGRSDGRGTRSCKVETSRPGVRRPTQYPARFGPNRRYHLTHWTR